MDKEFLDFLKKTYRNLTWMKAFGYKFVLILYIWMLTPSKACLALEKAVQKALDKP